MCRSVHEALGQADINHVSFCYVQGGRVEVFGHGLVVRTCLEEREEREFVYKGVDISMLAMCDAMMVWGARESYTSGMQYLDTDQYGDTEMYGVIDE